MRPTLLYSIDGINILRKSAPIGLKGDKAIYWLHNYDIKNDKAELIAIIGDNIKSHFMKHGLLKLNESMDEWEKRQNDFKNYWLSKMQANESKYLKH